MTAKRIINSRFNVTSPDGTQTKEVTLAELLYEVASRPRPGGITLAEMDQWLPVMRGLKVGAVPGWEMPIEHWEMLVSELKVFPFLRPDESLREVIRVFMAAKTSPDNEG